MDEARAGAGNGRLAVPVVVVDDFAVSEEGCLEIEEGRRGGGDAPVEDIERVDHGEGRDDRWW